jgi:glucose/arabinose dehydrogenase
MDPKHTMDHVAVAARPSRAVWVATGIAALLTLCACAEPARFTVAEGSGANPALPAPSRVLIPTVNIAPARAWTTGAMPHPAPGLRVQAFARDLDHPRWLLVLPNGDVLVAETNAPPKAGAPAGIKAWVMGLVMKSAGAAVPSPNRITLLRDTDGDGVADVRSALLSGLNSPFGMALVGERLFVANADAVLVYPYRRGDTTLGAAGTKLLGLPGGPINHHWTKSLLASPDGQRLYVGVGSNSNVGENGMAVEAGRAAIWEVNIGTGAHRVFASGLRNPVGMAWDAGGSTLWAVVNERDELGSDLVPDYLTSVRDGAFYGWPYSYYGQKVDTRVDPPAPERVAQAIAPDFALGAHVAPLGLASSAGSRLPAPFVDGMFVGQHGSWNRRPHSGYKVVHVPFSGGQPSGPARDVLSGFLTASGEARGRPVGVALDAQGALLVADDVGNTVWRVSAAP